MTLKITFADKIIKDNEEIDIVSVQVEPKVEYDYKDDKYYTVMMLDPDIPSREKSKKYLEKTGKYPFYLHWLRVNMTKNNNGIEILEYDPPDPIENTGLHRYFIVLFEHKTEITVPFLKRYNFDVTKFKNKYNLKTVDRVMFRSKIES